MRLVHAGVRLSLLLALFAVASEAVADEPRRVLRRGESETVDLGEAITSRTLESIAMLERLLEEQQPKGDMRAEMLFRLAELEYQHGRRLYLIEMEQHNGRYEECMQIEGCDPDALVPDHTESSRWYERSVAHGREIVEDHPRWKRTDEARRAVAFALIDLERKDEALESFMALVKLHPDSPFASEAYLHVGEHWFDANQAAKALPAYRRAAEDGRFELRDYARYKMAWCLYNLGDLPAATEHMLKVAYAAKPTGIATEGKQGDLALYEESLRDLVRFFADGDDIDGAREKLTRLGASDRIPDLLSQVAALHFQQGKFESAIRTWKTLIAESPDSPKAPDWQTSVIDATRKLGRPAEVHAEVERLRTIYGPRSSWARANASRPETVAAARSTVEEQLRRVALEHHDRGRRDPRAAVELLPIAAAEYDAYLQEFGDGEHAYDMRYAYAELLYKQKRFADAYDQYRAVVDLDPKGARSRFCAESAIFAADEMIKQQPKDAGWTEWHQKLVDATDRYAALYPDDKLKNVVYKSAYVLYHAGRYAEAAERFAVVIQLDPASAEAEQAAHLTLDALAVKKDWASLEKWAKSYYEQPGLGSKKFKAEVRDIWERAAFAKVEAADRAQQADGWVAFAAAFPQSELAGKALNNAAVRYREEGRLAEAIATRRVLVDDARFGAKLPSYADHLAALGYEHETIADFAAAATAYERLVAAKPDHAAAADAAWSAATLRSALGDTDAAVADWKAFLARFGSDPRAPEASMRLAALHESAGRWADAEAIYRSQPASSASWLRVGLVQERQGRDPSAAFEAAVAAWKKSGSPAGDDAAGEARYRLTSSRFSAFDALAIRTAPTGGPAAEDRALKASLIAKIEAFKALEAGYVETIATGSGPWGLQAALGLGDAYAEMAATLRDGDVPRYLDADQRDLYVPVVIDRAVAQELKAAEAWAGAREKALALGEYDIARQAWDRLHRLDPVAWPAMDEILQPPLVVDGATPGAFERSL
jgi:tetratricopeptide (TPR) repeat protein